MATGNLSGNVESLPGVNFDYTYNGILERDIVFCPTVGTPAIDVFFKIVETAKYRIRQPLVLGISNIVKASVDCARVFSDGIDITNTTIQLTELESNNAYCKSDFEAVLNTGNNLAEEFLKDGVEEWDPSGTEIENIITELTLDALRRDMFRIFFWGDTNDADTNWNQLDGVWTRLIAQNTPANAYCVVRASTTLGIGATLAAGVALNALQELYEESAIVLKQLPNAQKYFAVTGSIWENLLSSYEANVNGTERQFTNLVQGQGDQGTTLNYRGISVIPLYKWDQDLQDPGNPQFDIVRHAILYTTRENHIAAINTPSVAAQMSGFYNRPEREFWVESHWRMGYNFICCDLQSIAF